MTGPFAAYLYSARRRTITPQGGSVEPMTRSSSQTGRTDVYRALKDAIQYLDLMPGSVLHEAELTQHLNCSRTPIREALIRLSGEYLVEIYPQRSTYVAPIDFHLANEVAYMRHLLDSNVCLLLCRQKACISEAVEQTLYFMERAMGKDDVLEYIRLDNAFHRTIFSVAGHDLIWSSIANSRAHYNRVLVLDLKRPGMLQKSYQEHLQIVSSIEAGDAATLTAVMDVHHDHQNTDAREQAIRAQFPAYFAND